MPFAGFEDFDACVTANSEKDDPEAYCAAIKRQIEGSYPDDISAATKEQAEAYLEDGIELSDYHNVFSLSKLKSAPIEREELENNRVLYRNIEILQSGVWTDGGSKETVWYSPEGISNLKASEDNVVNIMHDIDNEVSAAGKIVPESLTAEDGSLFADIELDTSNAAGEYADANLQKTLETEGAKGFGGPSVEISAEGQEVEYNAERGVLELKSGIVTGLGFVANPASKPVSFARQTATREVALSDSGAQTTMTLETDKTLMDMEAMREILETNGVDTSDLTDEELKGMAESMMQSMDMEMQDDEEEAEEEEEEGEEDTEMEDTGLDALEEQIDDIWGAIEEMKSQMMSESELSEAVEEHTAELANEESVKELSEGKETLQEELEELESRLSKLEDKPEKPKSLASDAEELEGKTVTPVGEFDKIKQTYSR